MVDHKVLSRAEKVLEIAKNMANKISMNIFCRIEDIHLHVNGYADSGISLPKSGIIATGNWNRVCYKDKLDPSGINRLISDLPERVQTIFEKMGIECEWEDQWSVCITCGKLIYTDSCSSNCDYRFVDGEGYECLNCIKKDPTDYLSSLEGDSNLSNDFQCIDPGKHGYVKIEEPILTKLNMVNIDSPKHVESKLRKIGLYDGVLFSYNPYSYFTSSLDVYFNENIYSSLEDYINELNNISNSDKPEEVIDISTNIKEEIKVGGNCCICGFKDDWGTYKDNKCYCYRHTPGY
jgi:hypothetical protein